MSIFIEKLKEGLKTTDKVQEIDFGMGDGGNLVVANYLEYTEDSVLNRHFPSILDGLIPVNRALVYQAFVETKGKHTGRMMKSAKLVSDVMQNYHPHGDSSIYESMVRMTESNASFKIPLFTSSGGMSDVFTSLPPSQIRYTEVRPNEILKNMVSNIDGVELVAGKANDEARIPSDLPTKYPFAFIGAVDTGIATGASTHTVIYDVNDIAELVKEYLSTGNMTKILIPDYPTGGYIINNQKEFKKLMMTGRAKVTLRGTVEFRGKDIVLRNYPYLVKDTALVDQIDAIGMTDIKAKVSTDRNDGNSVMVTCKRKEQMKDVLNLIYAKTDFETTLNVNAKYLEGQTLRSVGLYEGIKIWVNWRKEVLTKDFTKRLSGLKVSEKLYADFVSLVTDKKNLETFLSIFTDLNKAEIETDNFLRSIEITDEKSIEWIKSRRISAFRGGGKYVDILNGIRADIALYDGYLNDLNGYISLQMDEMKQELARCVRRTEPTNEVMNFVRTEELPEDVTVVVKGNRISRLSEDTVLVDTYDKVFTANTEDNIVVGHVDGGISLLRVKNIPFGYPEVVGALLNRGYKNKEVDVLFIEHARDDVHLYFQYSDGFMSFLDLGEFNKKGLASYYMNGLPKGHMDKIVEHGIWTSEVANRVLVEISDNMVHWIKFDDITRKGRTSRTRVYYPLSEVENENVVSFYTIYEEVEGEWFMDERYNRQKPIVIVSNSYRKLLELNAVLSQGILNNMEFNTVDIEK